MTYYLRFTEVRRRKTMARLAAIRTNALAGMPMTARFGATRP
jgi:hypothetical protein